MRTRILAPLVVAAALAPPAAADAAVLCVGTSGGDCTATYPTTQDAIDAAVTGEDTIRFGAGTFGPVDTPKVLTYVGVGAGTPDSAAGATVIKQTALLQVGMNLPRGGTARALRVQGGPSYSSMYFSGTGIQFAPTTDGDMTLTLVDVIATGGEAEPFGYGGIGLRLGSSRTATGSKVANVTAGAFLPSSTPTALGHGVATCCIQSTIREALIRGREGAAVDAGIGSATTLEGSTIEGTTGISARGATSVTLGRSRVDAVSTGLSLWSEPNEPTNVFVRDSLVTAGPSSNASGAVYASGGDGAPMAFDAVASTFIGRGTSPAVYVRRTADASPAITTTLRNSVARAEGTGVDLFADRATIAADFSSFNTRTLENGGVAPEPGSGNNVAGDPLLAADYSLQPGSPLIDKGDPAAVLAGELDLAGAARLLDGNGNCSPMPDIGAFERPDLCSRPELANVGVTNKVFAPRVLRGGATAAARRRVKRGTRFRYTLSEPARVRIRVERRVRRRVSGRRITRYRRVATLVADEQAGRQGTAFSGRVRRRALRRGRYRARLIATDALGARSAERRVRFRIVRP